MFHTKPCYFSQKWKYCFFQKKVFVKKKCSIWCAYPKSDRFWKKWSTEPLNTLFCTVGGAGSVYWTPDEPWRTTQSRFHFPKPTNYITTSESCDETYWYHLMVVYQHECAPPQPKTCRVYGNTQKDTRRSWQFSSQRWHLHLCASGFIRWDNRGSYTDVSKNRGTLKSWILIGVFHYKPSILGGSPYFWKHPYDHLTIDTWTNMLPKHSDNGQCNPNVVPEVLGKMQQKQRTVLGIFLFAVVFLQFPRVCLCLFLLRTLWMGELRLCDICIEHYVIFCIFFACFFSSI